MIMDLGEHRRWQRICREDNTAFTAYLDMLEEDGRYPLLVKIGRESGKPSKSGLVYGTREFIQKTFTSTTVLPSCEIPIEAQMRYGPRGATRIVVKMDLRGAARCSHFLALDPRKTDIPGLFRSGLIEPADRMAVAHRTLQNFESVLLGGGNNEEALFLKIFGKFPKEEIDKYRADEMIPRPSYWMNSYVAERWRHFLTEKGMA